MNCIDLTSKRSKMFSFVAKHSKLCKTTKVIILQWIASILHQNDLKCSVTSQNIQNYAKLQKWSNHNELHQSDVRTIKTFELRPSTTKVIKLQWITSIWHQTFKIKTTKVQWIASILRRSKCSVTSNIQNAKLQKWSNYNELHRFDVRTIKTFELRPSTTKVIKLQWITSIWHQINQKCWETSQNIQNNA